MRFRQIAAALLACAALGALAASGAQAGQWTIGTTENQTTAGTKITSESVTCKRHGTTELVFTSKLLGSPIKITASGADCVNATIETTKEGVARGEGRLRLTGTSVIEPKNCFLAGNELTTEQLTSGAGGSYEPKFGTKFITFEFSGALCPLAEDSAQITGRACGERVHTNAAGTGFESNAAGTLTKIRTILSKAGGCELLFGGIPAQVSGAGDSELSGSDAGKPWGAD